MATGRETVANRALSGAELKQLLREDFDRLLDNQGLLSEHIAYGRIAYDIRLNLHMDNAMNPESSISIESKSVAQNTVALSPELASLEPPPLSEPSDEDVISGRQLSRTISSPNAERVRSGMPVPVQVKQQDGTTTTEQIKYPPQPELGDGEVVESDVTHETKAMWKPRKK